VSRSLIPHQLSEPTFRFYEPYIREGVARFPTDIAWDISLLAVEDRRAPSTFVARFRDAITSLRKFGWQTDIDTKKLLEISGKYCIWWEAGTSKVWFKVRSHTGKPAHHNLSSIIPADGARDISLASPVPWRDATEEELRALAVLLNSGRLVGPYEITGCVANDVCTRVFAGLDNSFAQLDKERNITVFT
jgi:hypothetical protein